MCTVNLAASRVLSAVKYRLLSAEKYTMTKWLTFENFLCAVHKGTVGVELCYEAATVSRID